jgi:uncharacterized linocin/CFP29 family protein
MRFLFVILVLIISLSCSFNNCDADGIIIEATLLEQAQKTGFPYCLSIQKSLKKDEIALLQLIRFAYKTDDASAIAHGITFTELSLKLGDDFMSNFISKQKDEHRLLIAKMFDACVEYREPSINLQIELPKSIQILTNK